MRNARGLEWLLMPVWRLHLPTILRRRSDPTQFFIHPIRGKTTRVQGDCSRNGTKGNKVDFLALIKSTTYIGSNAPLSAQPSLYLSAKNRHDSCAAVQGAQIFNCTYGLRY